MIPPIASGDLRLAIICSGAILLVGFLLGAGAQMTDRPPGILRFPQSCLSWLVGLILLTVGIILIPILLVMSGGNPRRIFPPQAMGDMESDELPRMLTKAQSRSENPHS